MEKKLVVNKVGATSIIAMLLLFMLMSVLGTSLTDFPMPLEGVVTPMNNFDVDYCDLPEELRKCWFNESINRSVVFEQDEDVEGMWVIWKNEKAKRIYDVSFVTGEVLKAEIILDGCNYTEGAYHLHSIYEVVYTVKARNRCGMTLFWLQAKELCVFTRINLTKWGWHCNATPLSNVVVCKGFKYCWTGKVIEENIDVYDTWAETYAVGRFYNSITQETTDLWSDVYKSCSSNVYNGYGGVKE